jgi:hypothetical protein
VEGADAGKVKREGSRLKAEVKLKRKSSPKVRREAPRYEIHSNSEFTTKGWFCVFEV